jgi:hypothetical protein
MMQGMTAAVIVLSVAAYLAGLILTARWWYGRIRPYTEPLSCKFSHHGESGHNKYCYQRPGKITATSREALGYALLMGAAWFATVSCVAVAAAIMAAGRVLVANSARDTPEEIAAKTARLEAENDRLRRQIRLAPPGLPRLLCLSRLRAVVRPLGAGLVLLPEDPPGTPGVVDAAPLGTVGFPSGGHDHPPVIAAD